jgi:hypothetical protein
MINLKIIPSKQTEEKVLKSLIRKSNRPPREDCDTPNKGQICPRVEGSHHADNFRVKGMEAMPGKESQEEWQWNSHSCGDNVNTKISICSNSKKPK